MTTLNDRIEFRVNNEQKQLLIDNADEVGKPYQIILRELITAFNNDTLRIHGKKYKELYSDD